MSNFSQLQKNKGLTFAEKQLKKHGWEKGKGLGKQENGISEAIKVKVKCDSAGVGHNSAEQFTFHWWDHLFNSSAANIAVETGQDGVKVKRVSEQDGVVTNKKPRKATGSKDMLYGRFVKAATLTSGGEEPLKPLSSSDSSEEDQEEKLDLSTARRLTDEELVEACGGRTAHKGARHGLTMSAKLARLEEQEAAFLASYKRQDGAAQVALSSSSSQNPTKRKKRKQARERDLEEVVCENERGRVAGEEEPLVDHEAEKKAKRRRKKEKRRRRRRQGGEGDGE
ncbi:PREDICTED: G patch domain-containing protein 4 [Gekko japonicus]|uniref:G patch domain-containing protein 4 n=1 Tax=Gekko japonicus TaxID=146911 RepID=A0ABM1KPZ6_GEKJA|nr:PREDICTED: G patch domain-containing protein 4 [Gekko japonicus]XP_015275783.1 PREDICTED: G patch domain-containing protein 4 [Gekko japonicus]